MNANKWWLFFRLLTKDWMKVSESVVVAASSAIILILLIYVVPDCHAIKGFHLPNNTEYSRNDTLNTQGKLSSYQWLPSIKEHRAE